MKSVARVLSQFFAHFLGAFSKKKKRLTFVMPVCLSVRPHRTVRFPQDGFFMKFDSSVFFENVWSEFRFHENLTRIMGTLHEDSRTFMIVKGKAVPLQAWSSPEGSRKLRFPDYVTLAQDCGKVVSLTHQPPLPPVNTPGTHFC